ncbi:MAG: cyclic nucleotide-binding domain-containing protein [Actinomycetota bacterium]
MKAADVLALSVDAPQVDVQPGAHVIRVGEAHASLYVLVRGVVEVRRGDALLATIDEPGSVIGEVGLLLSTPASADVVAPQGATMRRLDDADRLFREVPEFGQFLATTLARRLHRVSSWLGDLHEQFADTPGALGLVPHVMADLVSTDRADADLGSDREPDVPY